ncbi:WhiB family transcriptional regulator [Micromonospora sp. NBC_00421]|uniref:WhiB family transcriptional regulator n=1 Tax=Micromonospora sp. NBC_00421 TaxID=2975976 RepID=UPI002E1E0035
MSRHSFRNVANHQTAERPRDWRDAAYCRDKDPELHFPVGTSGPALIQTEQAKANCRRCPVKDECLSWALDSGQDHGVWGGMSEDERRAVKRRGGLRVLRADAA